MSRRRPGTTSAYYRACVRYLAIDIGGSKTAVAVVSEGAITGYTTWPSASHASESLDRIISTCLSMIDDISACGVAFGGVFDFPQQTCVRSMHVSGWEGTDISSVLQHALGIPVVTDNDANVAALGEYSLLDQHEDPLLYVTISTGVGAAIVANHQLIRGAHSMSGELGHLSLGHDKSCNCGQIGCFERAVSGYWLETDHGRPAADVLADPEIHRQWVTDIATGLWSASVVLDPAVIVIGGGMSAQGGRLLNPLTQVLAQKARQSKRPPPAVHLGDPTGRTVLVGAAVMAREAERGSR